MQGFSAPVALPCKAFWGPEGTLEFSGSALRITTRSIELRLSTRDASGECRIIQVGDQMDLEVLLPVYDKGAGARRLRAKARVSRIKELAGDSCWLSLIFRKTTVEDLTEPARQKTKAVRWAM